MTSGTVFTRKKVRLPPEPHGSFRTSRNRVISLMAMKVLPDPKTMKSWFNSAYKRIYWPNSTAISIPEVISLSTLFMHCVIERNGEQNLHSKWTLQSQRCQREKGFRKAWKKGLY